VTDTRPPDALRTMWGQPRLTVRWLIDEGTDRLWPWLVAGEIVSLEFFWDVASVGTYGSILGEWSPGFLALKLVAWTAAFAVLVGTATIVGRILNGHGSFRGVLLALAWGWIPGAAALPFVALAAAARLLGQHHAATWLLFGALILAAWGFVSSARAVAEAHRINALRGALAVALGIFLAYAPILALWSRAGMLVAP
jgi:hypothetical protein